MMEAENMCQLDRKQNVLYYDDTNIESRDFRQKGIQRIQRSKSFNNMKKCPESFYDYYRYD